VKLKLRAFFFPAKKEAKTPLKPAGTPRPPRIGSVQQAENTGLRWLSGVLRTMPAPCCAYDRIAVRQQQNIK